MNVTNIPYFLRVVTDLQPSTAPLLTSMQEPPPQSAIQAKEFQKYT